MHARRRRHLVRHASDLPELPDAVARDLRRGPRRRHHRRVASPGAVTGQRLALHELRRPPFVPGVDGVGRAPDGTLRYFILHDTTTGSMAEQTVIDVRRSVPLPEGSDPVRIAAAMNPAMSAWVALRRRVSFHPGRAVLVLAATGDRGDWPSRSPGISGPATCSGRAGTGTTRRPRRPRCRATVSLVGEPEEVAARLGQAARDVDVVLDYAWGSSAADAMVAMVMNRTDRGPTPDLDRGRLGGGTHGRRSPLPRSVPHASRSSAADRARFPTRDILAELPALAAVITDGARSGSTHTPFHSPAWRRRGVKVTAVGVWSSRPDARPRSPGPRPDAPSFECAGDPRDPRPMAPSPKPHPRDEVQAVVDRYRELRGRIDEGLEPDAFAALIRLLHRRRRVCGRGVGAHRGETSHRRVAPRVDGRSRRTGSSRSSSPPSKATMWWSSGPRSFPAGGPDGSPYTQSAYSRLRYAGDGKFKLRRGHLQHGPCVGGRVRQRVGADRADERPAPAPRPELGTARPLTPVARHRHACRGACGQSQPDL